MGGTKNHQGAFADSSQSNTHLCRARSIQIDSGRPPFLLHKDGFPPFPASGWLDVPTFHVVIFPNRRLNDFFSLPVIISWRNETKYLLKTSTTKRRKLTQCLSAWVSSLRHSFSCFQQSGEGQLSWVTDVCSTHEEMGFIHYSVAQVEITDMRVLWPYIKRLC